MPVAEKVKIPMLFSIMTGVCVLAADAYVLNALLHQHADLLAIGLAAVFALSVFALWLWGYYRSLQFLNQYAREEAALPQAATVLTAFAQDVTAHAKDGRWSAALSLAATTPLLDRRLKQICLALRRGSPLLFGDMADSEDRHFPGPERELRTYMDIVLNLGIAGTFVSILLTLGQSRGLTAETLLAHVGPGMTSGLAAVIANVGLRLCHRALQDEQDSLAERVNDTLSETLMVSLPKSVTSPEDRLVSATERVVEDTQGMLVHTLDKQNAATQKALTEQTAQFDTLLKQYVLTVGQILTRQVQQPIERIAAQTEALATHAGALVRHSGAWAEAVTALKTAHTGLLAQQREAQDRHEAAMAAMFAEYRASLGAFLETAKAANHAAMEEARAVNTGQLQNHRAAVGALLQSFHEEFAALQAEQEAVHRRLTDAALAAFGSAVDSRLSSVEERVAAALTGIEERLPDALRTGVGEGLDQTISLMEAVREQAAGLTHAVAQVSGNADRQLLAYERWQERAGGVQARLEQVVTDGHAAQSAMVAEWQSVSAQALEGVRSSFVATARDAQSGYESLAAALAPLQETLGRLQATTQELQSTLVVLPPLVSEARAALGETSPALHEMAAACHDMHAVLSGLSSSAPTPPGAAPGGSGE